MEAAMKRAIGFLGSFLMAAEAIAGFASSETFLPAVGRVAGQGGAQFYTTVWATNLTGATVNFTFDFLKQGQANATPASFADTLAPGQTKVYENVIESKLGLASAIGAARVVSTGEILVAERIYNQPPGADVGNTEGLFFAGVPKSFSISLGQSASIQGIDQGGSENFRYNFALVETGGGSPTVNVQLFDGNGALLGQKAYALQPYEQLQPGVADLFAGVATTNARITATVTGGTGSVLLAGAQLANESQDSSGFEMSFRDELLGGGGTAGVTSLNGLTGAVTLAAGSNVTLGKSGNTITVNASGGGGGGLTLPFSGSVASTTPAFTIENTGSSLAGFFKAQGGALVVLGGGAGVITIARSALTVESGTTDAISASSSTGIAIQCSSDSQAGLEAHSGGADGVFGQTSTSPFSGVYGTTNATGYGVFGEGDGINGGAAIGGNAAHGGLAAHFFAGNVRIDNDLHVTGKIFAGTKDFEIDHPLDPAGKYLVHASIESSEMLNIYSGNVRLDARGEAVVRLPAWMEAENADFRYQLTAIGAPARDLFVASEISGGEFRIAGGAPGTKVSWQVTGVRKDPWAVANPLVVEAPKSERDRGFYLHPELYGAAPEKQTDWAEEPDQMKRLQAGASGGSGGGSPERR
jgi:hypothetical protein